MEQLVDCYYFPLPSQGNMYSLSELPVTSGFSQVLFASLKRDIYCFEYLDTPNGLIPTTKEVPFTYIPSGAEIVSLCAFNKSATKNDFVIAIAIVKSNTELDAVEPYLNVYADWEENEEFIIENTAQNCFTIDLSYMPYHILHTYLVIWEDDKIKSKEHVLLVSGGDNHIHVYREHTSEHLYKEYDYKEHFPEFAKTGSPVQKMDVYYNENYSVRITAICCECGYVRLTKTNVKTNKVEFTFSTRFSNYTSSIKLYEEAKRPKKSTKEKDRTKAKSRLNLVVVNSLLPSVLFEDILTYGLSKYSCLPRIDDETNILTDVSCVDVDFDGRKEILIGGCNRSLNMYKVDHKGVWFLEYIKMLPSPVITQLICDINGDGVKELIILTMKGVIFLEYNHEHLNKILDARVKKLPLHDIKRLKI